MSSLFIITGASRGFGRSIAQAIASQDHHDQASEIMLLGRNMQGLQETERIVQKLNPTLKTSTHTVDFSSPTATTTFQSLLPPPNTYASVYLIHNAGSLGPLLRARELGTSPNATEEKLRSEMQVNILSPVLLTGVFLRWFTPTMTTTTTTQKGPTKVWVVNISSLAAIQPFDCWSLYALSKAARDMYFKNLALEEGLLVENKGRVKVLNYAPGPLDTDMQKQIREEMPDVELKGVFKEMHEEGKLVDPLDSAKVLLDLLIKERYVKGEHVDYYDVK
ncbi:hypothetical protein HDV05_005735 [Chytridiales sp. JEL 0842]|nr:hypothetical protein HDV05_005735 [Chytridiales sp. JEL 0842]